MRPDDSPERLQMYLERSIFGYGRGVGPHVVLVAVGQDRPATFPASMGMGGRDAEFGCDRVQITDVAENARASRDS